MLIIQIESVEMITVSSGSSQGGLGRGRSQCGVVHRLEVNIVFCTILQTHYTEGSIGLVKIQGDILRVRNQIVLASLCEFVL